MARYTNRDETPWGRWFLGLLAVVAVLLLFFTVTRNQENGIFNSLQPEQSEPQVQILDDIIRNPDNYIGRQVSVNAPVKEPLNDRMLMLEAPGQLPDDELLVISRQTLLPQGGGPDDYIYNKDDIVRISGTVRRLTIADLEEELGTDLDDAAYAELEGRVYIVADTIQETSL
ncbi:MAG: hypothetical protein UV73_C0010G0025 [Candidatus Gottesmanbacteria bacterium GW2011_GWA2_43_14]|uniref:Uncharacterized protein n=1 Tax=Candidatus Gottesmanbacteria bacterium GW2011_GWA2_43_14 TaxID=1618443 RepID=A0A0G1DEV0_9BACT|nr:MAG: hypothetical protein UV73_C0010G0025 [Candidatus Gottesmanbacteria bacterium GW2011_GWA2_43_14]